MAGQNALQAKVQREIGELSEALTRIVESFKQVQSPLQESKEKVPQATNQLDKISEQTEAAAHQMLDRIEKITQREDEIILGLARFAEADSIRSDTDLSALATSLTEKANTNLNDAFMIMDVLQFQDITAQQMNHAAALLEDIEQKLQNILAAISGEEPDEEVPIEHRTRVFDPHAEFTDKQTQQEDIDSLFSRGKTE
jgi:chemotaxis regulatin CheY-phosphate phosphatase CheZ